MIKWWKFITTRDVLHLPKKRAWAQQKLRPKMPSTTCDVFKFRPTSCRLCANPSPTSFMLSRFVRPRAEVLELCSEVPQQHGSGVSSPRKRRKTNEGVSVPLYHPMQRMRVKNRNPRRRYLTFCPALWRRCLRVLRRLGLFALLFPFTFSKFSICVGISLHHLRQNVLDERKPANGELCRLNNSTTCSNKSSFLSNTNQHVARTTPCASSSSSSCCCSTKRFISTSKVKKQNREGDAWNLPRWKPCFPLDHIQLRLLNSFCDVEFLSLLCRFPMPYLPHVFRAEAQPHDAYSVNEGRWWGIPLLSSCC